MTTLRGVMKHARSIGSSIPVVSLIFITEAAAQTKWTCTITRPPAGTHIFYGKYCNVGGIPIMGSAAVDNRAFQEAAIILEQMLQKNSYLIARLVARKTKVAIVGRNQKIASIPEYRNFPVRFPHIDYNTVRGLGGTVSDPLTSASEENLMCEKDWNKDPWTGESILIHEFAHSIMNIGLVPFMPAAGLPTSASINALYANARTKRLWLNTYAITNRHEYWAETTQSYFSSNLSASPSDGNHNSIDTRAKLRTYDTVVYAALAKLFPTNWLWNGCSL